MKFPDTEVNHYSIGVNTATLFAVSLLWGHMLGLITWWALPLTVLLALVGYGTEIQERKQRNTISL